VPQAARGHLKDEEKNLMVADKTRVLAIDDDEGTLRLLERALTALGWEVATAMSGEAGLKRYAEEHFDLVLLDLVMPGLDGFAVLERLKKQDSQATVVIMTGHASIESVVRAMKGGAQDYVDKPLDLDYLKIALDKALASRRQSQELNLLREQLEHQGSFEGMVGVSPAMQQVYERVRRLAPGDTTVLIQGETGTGKELVAKAIHHLSHRREKSFMPINCGALPENILESELFGHEKGAFTGAVKQKYGLIEQAEGGTLFLDEVEAMSPAMQVKLLRALQERQVLRVGGDRPIAVDFRLVAATGADLRGLMEREEFRPDLYYRLRVALVELPPLRQRGEDVILLAQHFARLYGQQSGRGAAHFTSEALMLLRSHPWPGNVRELENVVEQAVVLSSDGQLCPGDLPEYLRTAAPSNERPEFFDLPLRQARQHFERRYLEWVLERASGQVAEAARLAGLTRQHFYEKMKRCGLSRN
jgi:two-component system response regulator HydG/two-component system response regulator AtoC